VLSTLEVAGEVVPAGSGMAEDLPGDALGVYKINLTLACST